MKARTVPQAAAEFTRANQTAVAAILADTDRYGGDSAALVRWARAVGTRHTQQRGAEAAGE